MRMSFAILFVTLLWARSAGAEAAIPIQPDPKVQKEIDRLTAPAGTSDSSRAEWYVEIEKAFRTMKEEEPVKLVQQLLYHQAAHAGPGNVNEHKRLVALLILGHLQFNPRDIVEAVVPYMDTQQRILRRAIRTLLVNVDRTGERWPDYSHY
jgi:hypothetical protein